MKQSETLRSILSESGHSLEEVFVKSFESEFALSSKELKRILKDMDHEMMEDYEKVELQRVPIHSRYMNNPVVDGVDIRDGTLERLLPLLQILRDFNPRVSAIEMGCDYDWRVDFTEVARLIARHFTHLTMFRFLRTFCQYTHGAVIGESTLAAVETMWNACANLQSFQCTLDCGIHMEGVYAYMDFDHGHLTLRNAFSSLPVVQAAFQRFGGSIVSLKWELDFVDDVSDVQQVPLLSTCSKLQHIHYIMPYTNEATIIARSSLPHLTSISLDKCYELTVKGVIEIIKTCRLLRHLKLCSIGCRGNDTLNEHGDLALSNMSSYSMAHGGSVESIEWDAGSISDDGLSLLTSMCSKLQHFRLQNANNVTDEGLIRALSSLPHLTSISLDSCDLLTVAGLKSLIERCRLVRHFMVQRIDRVDNVDYENQFAFKDGAITGKGDLYWPLAEVFSCRQRDTLKAIGDRLPP
jgi:hypothetical protein